MRIIDTGITKEVLSGDNQPQLKIGDKLYTVDDRQKTWEKIQEVQNDSKLLEKEKTSKIYELALGKEASKEISDLNLSVSNATHLSYCIMGAIIGESPETLEQQSKEQMRKN